MALDEVANDDRAGPAVLLLTKLYAPAVREQAVPREHLLEALRRGSVCRLSLVVAPAGFGKSTLLAAWRQAELARKPVAWVSLDDGDNDPVVLWSYVIAALRQVCPDLGESAIQAIAGSAPILEVALPRLVNELTEQGDVALVLDDFHRLTSGPARDSLAWFVANAPSTLQVVVATRTEPAVPLAVLRARGELLELRADDLRFTCEDADALLNDRLELGLAREDVEDLVERTEGWPAGLYLASLSLGGVEDKHGFVSSFGATSRPVVDFLVEEVLEAHDLAQQSMMLRTSVLDRLCGPLCDAVDAQEGGADRLDALARSNLFLVALDDRGEWYRFHHLFAQLLRVELEHREPGLAPELHRRAHEWHRDHGSAEEAIHHALEAGAFVEAGESIAAVWIDYANECRYATVLAWLQRFPDATLRADIRLLLVEAWVLSMSGRREDAVQTIAEIEHLGGLDDGPLPDGFSSAESSLTTLQAIFPGGDIGNELRHALRAAELEPTDSPWRPVACLAVGHGFYFRGELEQAAAWFKECTDLAPASEQWLVAGSSLAYRSLIAGDQGRMEEQRLLAEEATEMAREYHLEEADGEIPLALAIALAAQGRFREALPLLDRALAVLRSWGEPIFVAEVLIRQASVLRAGGEREQAAAAIGEARSVLASCPDPGVLLLDRLEALEQSANAAARTDGGKLSQRELEVLRLLQSSLSESEIASELYVSHNTVHSHTRAIYRKLGVSSRSEAVERARQLGVV
jgi:LuxR family transcriptional regulator, maltose regulon positive regulatory protein